jgi:hypothetical protein
MLNTGLSLWKAQNALVPRGVQRLERTTFCAVGLVRNQAAALPAPGASPSQKPSLAADRIQAANAVQITAVLWELWTIGLGKASLPCAALAASRNEIPGSEQVTGKPAEAAHEEYAPETLRSIFVAGCNGFSIS